MKKGEAITFGNGAYIVVKEGSIISIANPHWDGDLPETHFNIEVKVLEDVIVETKGLLDTFKGEILEIPISDHIED